jgi:hypothetical protein
MALSKINAAEQLMKQVYGDWDVLDMNFFPKPLPATEAGPSNVKWGEKGECQRRYLWTDAFGLLNFVTLAQRYPESRRGVLLDAAKRLIDAVHATLGQPRSSAFPMAVQANSSYGFKGLRIGKEKARSKSDAGMEYDGMYWHYLDKWFFALLRYYQVSGDHDALRDAIQLIKALHPAFLQKSMTGQVLGLHWKMNVDLTSISELGNAYPNDDALSGYIVYSLVKHASLGKGFPSLERECIELGDVARQYILSGVRIFPDPLGFGLWGWKSQWLGAEWSQPILERLRRMAPIALDVESGRRLPFRMYGAFLGAQLVPDKSLGLAEMVEHILNSTRIVEHELNTRIGGGGEHSCINKVMLASALDPLAFMRIANEPVMAEPIAQSVKEEL